MATTSTKRSLTDTDIDASNPSKKRKLNEDNASNSTAPSTKDAPLSPTSNPEIKDLNIIGDNNGNENSKDENKNDNTANIQKEDDPNSVASNWSFKASAFTSAPESTFTFGDNSWVKQASSASDLSNDGIDQSSSNKSNGESIPNDNTVNSFSEFAGLGFKKVLDDENSKDVAQNGQDKKQESKSDDATDKKEDSGWGGAWSNANADGTFKLSFDNWGSWGDQGKIDLSLSSSVGWGSQAKTYDPDAIEQDDETKKVLEQMAGEQDTGDKDDEVKCSIHCKVYNLESGKYVERGKGRVNVNTYSLDEDDKKIRGRILCRRDQILTTIVNAPILKEMKFEKVGSFIRFGVVEKIENDEKHKDDNTKKEDKNETENNDKGKKDETEKDEKNKDQDDNDDDDDDDMSTQIKTYLIKPIGKDKSQIDTLLNKIKEIQELLSN